MSMPSVDGHLQIAVWMITKASVLLATAEIVHAVLRRRRSSAATRHLVWTVTVVSLLLLPILSAVLPDWPVTVRLMATTAPDAAAIVERGELVSPVMTGSDANFSSPADSPLSKSAGKVDIPWSTALSSLYSAGVLLLLARLMAKQVAIQRLARRATDVREPELTRLLLECAQRMGVRRRVRLLRSREHTMPIVFGTRVPTIVLPAIADTWSQDRRRAVLLHELAHVARYDCLTQLAAGVASAVYWIHPGVWCVARRLRVERELACDDRVLTAGTDGREYAGHLLELAYSLGNSRAATLAVGMARPRQIEERMLAVLDAARNRVTPAPRSRLAAMAMMVALLVPLAGVKAALGPAGADSAELVNPIDTIDQKPRIIIRSIEFVGNRAVGSGTLKRQMKRNKERSIWMRLFAGRSTYQEAMVREDGEAVEAYYRNHGYITARVGVPQLRSVRASSDKNMRVVDLRIPIVEGNRYRVGEISFAGNAVISSGDLRTMFKVERGTYYSENTIRTGMEKAREVYGAAGYYEFAGYPDFKLSDRPGPIETPTPESLQAGREKVTGLPIVDITMRLDEGKQSSSTPKRSRKGSDG